MSQFATVFVLVIAIFTSAGCAGGDPAAPSDVIPSPPPTDCTPSPHAPRVDVLPCGQPVEQCSFFACVPGWPDTTQGLCQAGYVPKTAICTQPDGGAGHCTGLGDCE